MSSQAKQSRLMAFCAHATSVHGACIAGIAAATLMASIFGVTLPQWASNRGGAATSTVNSTTRTIIYLPASPPPPVPAVAARQSLAAPGEGGPPPILKRTHQHDRQITGANVFHDVPSDPAPPVEPIKRLTFTEVPQG